MKKSFLFFLLCVISFSLYSQSWTPINGRQRFVSGLGLPVRDTITNSIADSAQILFRPYDSTLYFRYKSFWRMIAADSSLFATKYYVGSIFAYKNGTNSTGTWPINISGNASTVSNGIYYSDTTYTGNGKVLTQTQAQSLYGQPFKQVFIKGNTNATSNNTAGLFNNVYLQSRKKTGDTLAGVYINPTIIGDSTNDLSYGVYIGGKNSGSAYFGAYNQSVVISGQSSLTNGTYTNVPTTSTTGIGATLNITVTGTSPNQTVTATIANGGYGYFDGDILTVQKTAIGGTSGTVAFTTTNASTFVPITLNINKTTSLGQAIPTIFQNYLYNGSSIANLNFTKSTNLLNLTVNNQYSINASSGIYLNNATTLYSTVNQSKGYLEPYNLYDYQTTTQKFTAANNSPIYNFKANSTYLSGGVSGYSINGGSGYRDTTGAFSFTTSGYGGTNSNVINAITSGGVLSSVNFYPSGAYSSSYNFKVGDTIRLIGLPGGTGAYILVTSNTPTNSSYNGYGYISLINDSTSSTHYNNFIANPTISTGVTFSGKIRGFYYNPTITTIGNGTSIGFENTTGNNYFNTTGGRTAIGYADNVQPPKMFNVKGSINFNRDSIAIAPNTKWKLGIDSVGNIVRDSVGGTAGVTFDSTITAVSDASGTITLNCNNQSQKSFYVILTGTGRTVTLSNAVQNGVYTLQIFQDATGSRTITTWTNGKYPGQTIPTQTSAANSQDMAVITYKNGYYYIHYNNNY